MGKTEGEYNKIILETARAVFDVREHAGIRPFHGMLLRSILSRTGSVPACLPAHGIEALP